MKALRRLWIRLAQRGWLVIPPATIASGRSAQFAEDLSAYVKEALDLIVDQYPCEWDEFMNERFPA